MADRFPLIANPSTNQIQEMPSGDQLDLTGNNIANAGIITATSFHGNGANITGITQLGTLSSLNVSGNASIGGVLTYEDVTNVDSVGIVTARAGVRVPDTQKIYVGTGNDLFLEHDSNNSIIRNTTGDLYIQNNGSGTIDKYRQPYNI